MRSNWKGFFWILIFIFGIDSWAQEELRDLLSETDNNTVIKEYISELSQDFKLNEEHGQQLRTLGIEKSANSIKDWEKINLETESSQGHIYFNNLQVEDNETVRFFIQYYATLGRVFLQRALGRMHLYWPVLKDYAKELGVPLEVAVLGVIESGYNPRALSPKGAAGVWQLMPGTARAFKLKINSQLDERMDIYKSTYAALRFLKELSQEFCGNWNLALAAYNGGGNYLKKQLAKHNKETFWDVCQVSGFKTETLEFVPRFHAVLHIMKNPGEYLFKVPELNQPLSFDVVQFRQNMSFEVLKKYAGVPLEMLEELNPHLRGNQVISQVNVYVPRNFGSLVQKKIRRYYAKLRLEKIRRRSLRIVYYRVRKNDTLSKIAKRFRVPSGRIKRYNRLSSRRFLQVGQLLKIPVYRKGRKYAGRIIRAKKKRIQASIYYRVRKGDTLSSIAKKYRTSVQRIKGLNGIRSSFLRAGQKLKLPRGKKYLRYKIERGDTLLEVAEEHGVSWKAIMRLNKLKSRNHLAVGRVILIPNQES